MTQVLKSPFEAVTAEDVTFEGYGEAVRLADGPQLQGYPAEKNLSLAAASDSLPGHDTELYEVTKLVHAQQYAGILAILESR